MKNDWRPCTVSDLVKEKIIAPPMDGNHGEIHPKGDDFISSGVPFIMASDLNEGVINFEKCKYISKEQADSLRKGFAHEGDVLLSHKATIGQTAIVPDIPFPYLMLTPQVTYYRVLDSEKLNNYFLKYYFDSKIFQTTLNLWSGAGSTRAYLGITGQKELPLVIPEINVQRNIADVLHTIDKKIGLNNRINTELEAMAKLIYDYWFVQFDFPDANGKPYKSSGGKMVYSQELKREIPEGWEVASLLDIATFTNGIACQKYKPCEGEATYKVIKIREMGNGFNNDSELVSQSIPEKVVVKNGDVLFSWSATLDVMIWSGGVGGLNQHIFKVTSSKYPRTFYYFETLRYLEYFKMVASLRKTTMGHITREHLDQSRLSIPPSTLIQSLHDKIDPMLRRVIKGSEESIKLASLRDWLLPMLMNGQVTVKDAEQELAKQPL